MTVRVQPAEYFRLLGYPPDYVPSGRACELVEATREWYASHGNPWTHTREIERAAFDGARFSSRRLRKTLDEADSHAVVLVAASAGPEAEEEAQRLWREEKPDEYFFLEVYASAIVESLITDTGAQLCAWAEERGAAVLPHYSPGFAEWDVAEQSRLRDLMGPLPGRLEVLDSGALRPKKSQLAVFGVTRRPEYLGRLTDSIPCERCSFGPCQYRRAPYRPGHRGSSELPILPQRGYATNKKALRRWAAERLEWDSAPEGRLVARFRYDGTTCTNQGRSLAFDYRVTLGPREAGYPILEQCCAPAAGDAGYRSMCEYIANGENLMNAIGAEKPLLGRPLAEVLTWRRNAAPAGCYCDRASREHKWGLVLETIHYALHEATGRD